MKTPITMLGNRVEKSQKMIHCKLIKTNKVHDRDHSRCHDTIIHSVYYIPQCLRRFPLLGQFAYFSAYRPGVIRLMFAGSHLRLETVLFLVALAFGGFAKVIFVV